MSSSDAAAVEDALLSAGKPLGLVRVGGLAYSTNGIESGWIPTPTAGIYSAPELQDYRRALSLFSYEGQKPLHGSFFSENIEDYYVNPYELGYGKSIRFNHRFIGDTALQGTQNKVARRKVTLVLNPDDVREVLGTDPGTPVEMLWGQHPGAGTAAQSGLNYARLRATVQPAPYNDYARTRYRRDSP